MEKVKEIEAPKTEDNWKLPTPPVKLKHISEIAAERRSLYGQSRQIVAKENYRVGKPFFIKINHPFLERDLPRADNIEFIDYSLIDGFPVYRCWGECSELASKYPIEELIR